MRCAQKAVLATQWRRYPGTRPFSMTTRLLKDADPLSALLEEMESCDTSAHPQGKGTPVKLEEAVPLNTASASPPPVLDARLRLEEAKQKRLQNQLRDVGEELDALLSERSRTASLESSKAYVPARAAKTFFSSAEPIQEKSLQEFIPDEKSAEEVAKLPSLQHSGCAAVVTMVGVVIKGPCDAQVVFPGDEAESGCTEFTVRYDIPFVQARSSMVVVVRAIGATLSAFAHENVGVGDLVHVLGHLAPFSPTEEGCSSCAVYVLPTGGNISVVLSKASC